MAVVRGNKPNFLERVARQRLPAGEREKPAKLVEPQAKRAQFATLFEGSSLRAGSLAEHGASLKAIQPHLTALAGLAKELEPADANQLHRALEGFSENLGQHLDLVPAGARPLLAATAGTSLRELSVKLQNHRALVPALAVATQMLEGTPKLVSQGALEIGPAEHADAVRKPFDAVLALVRRLDTREGTGTALNALAHISGKLEAATPHLTNPQRTAIRGAVSDFLAETAPRSGLTPELTAHLTREVSQALAAQETKNFQEALQTAHASYRALGRPAKNEALRDLLGVPRGISAGTPEEAVVLASRRVLAHIVEENPSGPPALFAAVKQLDAALNEQIRLATNEQRVVQARELVEGKFKPVEVAQREPKVPAEAFTRAMHDVTALIVENARSPASTELLRFVTENAAALLAPAAAQDVAAAAVAPDAGQAARALLTGAMRSLPEQCHTPELAAAAERLAQLKGPSAFRALAAAEPHLANPQLGGAVLGGLEDYFLTRDGTPSTEDVARFVGRLAPALDLVRPHLGETPQARAVAERLASLRLNLNVDPALLAPLAESAKAAAPHAFSDLLAPDGLGRPGLLELADPTVRRRAGSPKDYYPHLAAVVARSNLDAAARAELTRDAAALASAMTNIDGEPAVPFRQALADWTVALSGQQRIQGVPAADFLRAHPELPIEVAATAGLHLNAEQLAWVSDHFAKAQSRDQFRSMRNFVLACVATNHLDLLETVRVSPSSPRVRASTLTSVGRRFRLGEPIEWDEIAAGLKEGRDPVGEIIQKKGQAALAAMGPVDAEAGNDGVNDLKKAAAEIASIEGVLKGAGREEFFAPWKEALQAAAQGRWPAHRYETESGRRVMGRLTPAQQAAWRTASMTTAEGAAAAAPAPVEATPLVAGLLKALPAEVRLGGVAGLDLKWDDASRDALVHLRDQLLEKVRSKDTEKGSPEHRRLGTQLGIVQRNLAVLELHQALAKPGAAADLAKLTPTLKSAVSSLGAFGATGAAEAVEELLFDAQRQRPGGAPRGIAIPAKGTVATDEDGFATMITSHQGGCLNPLVGSHRHELTVGLTTANFRMTRVYRDGKQVYRALIELLPATFPGYQGHALWVDVNDATGGGTPADQALLWRHILSKAERLGVPLMAANAPAQGLWLMPQNKFDVSGPLQVSFSIEEGPTGSWTHIDNLVGHGYNVRQARGANAAAAFARNIPLVVTPKPKG